MKSERFMLRAAVYLMLLRDKQILLLRRFNTGWQDGKYSLIAGHLDGNETVIDTMIREAKEEAGIAIKQEDLRVVHTMHRISKSNYEYIDFFLTARTWKGGIKNQEPDKCDELEWFSLEKLPPNTLPHVKQALDCYSKRNTFSEMNF